jgi:hypothetical protein
MVVVALAAGVSQYPVSNQAERPLFKLAPPLSLKQALRENKASFEVPLPFAHVPS